MSDMDLILPFLEHEIARLRLPCVLRDNLGVMQVQLAWALVLQFKQIKFLSEQKTNRATKRRQPDIS